MPEQDVVLEEKAENEEFTINLTTAERKMLFDIDSQYQTVLSEAAQVRGLDPKAYLVVGRSDTQLILKKAGV